MFALFQKPVFSSKAPTSHLSTSLSWQNAAALTQARRVIREADGRAGKWYRIVFLDEGEEFGWSGELKVDEGAKWEESSFIKWRWMGCSWRILQYYM